MSLLPFEKIALDALDRRTIKQFQSLGRAGRRALSAAGIGGKLLYGLGRGLAAGGKVIARGTEKLSDQIVRHPTWSAVIGVPLAYNAYKFPGNLDRSLNNVMPENFYQYR